MDKQISPGLRITFLVHFILSLVFGVLMIIFPQVWGTLSGKPVFDYEMYRIVGVAILAFGVSSWLGYQAKNWEHIQIVVVTEISWTVMATIILLYYLIRWYFPPLYWLPTILMAGFAAAFAFFFFKKK